MEFYKNETEKLYIKVKELKKIINELNVLINESYNKINIFNEMFQKQYLYNKLVFDSYNTNKLNYNLILNMKNFNFNKEEFIQSINSVNMTKINQLIIDINSISDLYYNKFISFEYIEGFSFPLKFCFENLFENDKIKEIINENEELSLIQRIEDEVEVFDESSNSKIIKIISNLIFKNKDNKILCEIKYNKNKKELIISHIGEIENLIFLIYDGMPNKSTVKNFGEIKHILAQIIIRYIFPLCFNISNKNFLIKNNGKALNYIIEENKKCQFKKINFFSYEEIDFDYDINYSKNYSQIIISEVNPNEWNDININSFLNKKPKEKVY